MPPKSHSITLEELRSGLPHRIMTWSREDADQIYTPQTIFNYINGGAEVYKAYNMRRCLSVRYETSGGLAIILDVFDMGTSEDAFGVFTHDGTGDVVALGQNGRLRPGWVNFWKDRFFISLYSEEETDTAQKAIMALGRNVDSLIADQGRRPEILKRLPKEGLKSKDIRYLHHPVVLNYHYYFSDENLLNLSPRSKAVLAGYQRDNEQALVLLVAYPDATSATRANEQFTRHYLANADNSATVQLENQKWAGSRIEGRLLVIILEADSRQLAENLLHTVKLVEEPKG